MTSRPGFPGSRLALAVALSLPPVAWYGAQQGLGALVRLHCAAAPIPGGAAGLAALMGCAAAVWLSLGPSAVKEGPPARTDAMLRVFVRLGAAIFALAIVLQTLAVLIVPACAR